MLRLRQKLTRAVLLPKLVRWLTRDAAIAEEAANWVVNSWAMAFSIIPFADKTLTRDDEIKKSVSYPDKIRLEGHTKFVTSVTFNAQGTHLASSSWDGTVHLWDVNNLSNHRIFAPHADNIQLNKEVMILAGLLF
jgi:WD40 repeat protein